MYTACGGCGTLQETVQRVRHLVNFVKRFWMVLTLEEVVSMADMFPLQEKGGQSEPSASQAEPLPDSGDGASFRASLPSG